MRDRQRFESLRKLAPREAVQAWLNGEFGIDDEPALIEALRRDPRVIGSDDQIIDTFCNAMVRGGSGANLKSWPCSGNGQR